MSRRMVIAGGAGFCGGLVAKYFGARDWEIVVLTRGGGRSGIKGVRPVEWDGCNAGPWTEALEGAAAVVNFCGRTVDCRYTPKHRREILDSRVLSTRALGTAIAQCIRPPPVWLNASTATIYRHSFDKEMGEDAERAGDADAKDEFSVEVAMAWEAALDAAATPTTRKIPMRMSMVFSPEPGTVYRVLRRLARFGLGGTMAGGRQYVSWIHELDFCRAIEWLLTYEDLQGPFNLAAPQPVTNAEMMRILRQAVRMPIGLPATRWMLEIGAFILRTETELMIKSRRVVPVRLLASGFKFAYSDMSSAVNEIETRV